MRLNCKNIFLVDGLGAVASFIFTGIVLPFFSIHIGLSRSILHALSVIPLGYALFSFYCFYFFIHTRPWKLIAIMIANFAYCVLSFLLILNCATLTGIGRWVLAAEIVVVLGVVILEINTYLNSTQTPEVKIVKKLFSAINRNDISDFVQFCDPQVVRIEPSGFPTPGVYRGHEEVLAHLSKGRETWAEGRCEPEWIFSFGEKVIANLYVRVRLKDRSDWIEGRFADGFVFNQGQVIQMRTFAKRSEAIDWATRNRA